MIKFKTNKLNKTQKIKVRNELLKFRDQNRSDLQRPGKNVEI